MLILISEVVVILFFPHTCVVLFPFLFLCFGYLLYIWKTICRNHLKSYIKVSFPDQIFICFYQVPGTLSFWDHFNPSSKLEVPWTHSDDANLDYLSIQGLAYFQFTFTLKVASCLGFHLHMYVGRVGERNGLSYSSLWMDAELYFRPCHPKTSEGKSDFKC